MWEQRRALSHCERVIGVVINLQVFLQPVVLLKEELLAKLEIEVNLGGEGDDVR